MSWHDHRGSVKEDPVISLYTFTNESMETDVVDEKTGKVLNYKTICVNAASELNARAQVYRPKIDKTGTLDPEWKLVNVQKLGKDWQAK